MTEPQATRQPFFLVGCVRSGTTLLRDLLKSHPALACPEETHFFRWPHPFASGDFMNIQQNNGTLQQHRRMDKVDEGAFQEMLFDARTRRDLQDRYAAEFLKAQPAGKQRWFDKTPQNVYGMLLLSAVYPQAKFIHIHRHPYNVVASLKAGKVMAKHSLTGAINAWLEAILIVRQFESAWPERVHNVSYEALTADTSAVLDELMGYLGESPGLIPYRRFRIHREKNKYEKELTSEEVGEVKRMLEPQMMAFGYA